MKHLEIIKRLNFLEAAIRSGVYNPPLAMQEIKMLKKDLKDNRCCFHHREKFHTVYDGNDKYAGEFCPACAGV